MSEISSSTLRPEQNTTVNHIVDALDKLPTLDYQLEGRHGPSFTPYAPIDSELFFLDVDAVKLLLDIATHTYSETIPGEDMPDITQFLVDTINGGERILLNATAGNFTYHTSMIIRKKKELFVSIVRFAKNMQGPSEDSIRGTEHFLYEDGEYVEGICKAII